MNITSLTKGQMQAVELIALKPAVTNREIARELDMSENTVSSWRKNPEFITTCFERFRELYGMRLMNVMEAMFREAEEGSVPAARLILEHYGKLNTQINIKIDSPWERFLKNEKFADAEVIAPSEAIEIGQSIEPSAKLPPRNKKNNNPNKVTAEQNKSLKSAISSAKKIGKKKVDRNQRYALRKRAEVVGLDPLPPGRPDPHKRKLWMKELVKKEKALGINHEVQK